MVYSLYYMPLLQRFTQGSVQLLRLWTWAVTTDVPVVEMRRRWCHRPLVPPQDALFSPSYSASLLKSVLIQDMEAFKRAEFLFDISDIVNNHLLLYSKLLST